MYWSDQDTCIACILSAFHGIATVGQRIVCNEEFKILLIRHLKNEGKVLCDFKEENLDEAFQGSTYDLTYAEVYPDTVQKFDFIDEYLGTPFRLTNHHDVAECTYSKQITYTEGLEQTKAYSTGWNITGGLSAEYKGVGASSSIGYTKNQSKVEKKSKTESKTERIEMKVKVPEGSKREVVVMQRYQRKECLVKNVYLIIPKGSMIKCRVIYTDKSEKYKMKEDEKINVVDILQESIDEATKMRPYFGTDSKSIVAVVKGKYVWVESHISLEFKKPEPAEPLQ